MPDKYLDGVFHSLKNSKGVFTPKVFEEIFRRLPGNLILNMIYELKKKNGLNINDMISFVSLLKKHHGIFWDIYVQ